MPPSIGSVKNLPEAKLCASPLLQITLQHTVHIKRKDYSSGSNDPWRIFFACTVQLRKTRSGSPETECQQLGVVRDQEVFFFLTSQNTSIFVIEDIKNSNYDVWKSPWSDWEETSAHVRAGSCFLVCSGRLHVMAFLESGLTDQTGWFASSRKQLSQESSDCPCLFIGYKSINQVISR